MKLTESLMAEVDHFPGSTALKHRQNAAPKLAPEGSVALEPDRYCVYNESQERFISTDVLAVGDFNVSADVQLENLAMGGRAALWISPFEEISATSVRFPLDLIYLSSDCTVLNTVESFPISDAPSSRAQAASILALPAETLARGKILPGDQLIISTPEEMKQQLRRLQEAKDSAAGGIDTVARQSAVLTTNQQTEAYAVGVEAQNVSEEESDPDGAELTAVRDNTAAEKYDPAPATAAAVEFRPVVDERPWAKRAASRNWIQRLLLGDAPDPRNAPRVAIPGLAVYFFTGSTPMAHEVRDISTSGLYIFTSERWYMGTVVRLTLCDRHDPRTERSLTMNARVARWGSDGVGLEFILEGDDRFETRHVGRDHMVIGGDVNRLKAFMESLQRA